MNISRASPVKQLLLNQFLVAMGVSAAALLFDIQAAYSAFLGGLICLIPNAYFARRVFRHRGALAARQILRGLYIGEAVKLALTAILFALVFVNVRPLNVLMLFVGFMAVQLVVWLTLLVTRTK